MVSEESRVNRVKEGVGAWHVETLRGLEIVDILDEIPAALHERGDLILGIPFVGQRLEVPSGFQALVNKTNGKNKRAHTGPLQRPMQTGGTQQVTYCEGKQSRPAVVQGLPLRAASST